MLAGVICGRGGQGIVTLNRLLGSIAARLGHPVLSAETHGMAMRGGSVATFVKIGACASPSIAGGTADFVLATDADEALRSALFLRPGGLCLVDAAAPFSLPAPIETVSIDATGMAAERFGNPVFSGRILLGRLFAAFPGFFPPDRILSLLPEEGNNNSEAVQLGLERKGPTP
jgi:indolepyruvate ferredoxin oxidoreductase beta subunit